MLQLYGNSRSRAMRCLWMLEEMGKPYQLIEKSTRADDLQDSEYLRLNPNARIPTLTSTNEVTAPRSERCRLGVASDLCEPNGQFVVTPAMAAAFVETLPVGKFHGVGPVGLCISNEFPDRFHGNSHVNHDHVLLTMAYR